MVFGDYRNRSFPPPFAAQSLADPLPADPLLAAGAGRCEACGRGTPGEPLATVTVRMPRSLHRALRDEAHRRRTSLNRLCVEALAKSSSTGGEP
jgi:hypothetical protein